MRSAIRARGRVILVAVALADEPFEAYLPHEQDHDDAEQFGLGRGLGPILRAAAPMPAVQGRGLDSLFPRSIAPAPAPPPMPVLPAGPRWQRVHAADAPRREEIDAHLVALTDDFAFDVAAHLRPGPGGGRLLLHRPERQMLSAATMDELCRDIRDFAGSGRLRTDDLDAAGWQCVVFGPRPLGDAGVYVVGRRDVVLTMDERWAIHRRLVAVPLSA